MTRRILHVVTDPSFMDFVSGVFDEVAPGSSTFAAVDVAPEKLRLPEAAHVVAVTSDPAGLRRLDALVADSRMVIFHGMKPKVAGVMAAAPSTVMRVWSGWGGDYYGNAVDSNAGLLGAATKRLASSGRRPATRGVEMYHTARVEPALRAAARATDVFSAPVPDDFAVFRRRFRAFRGRYSQLNYASVEDSIATGALRPLGNDILVGNSATPVNNHVEVLELLSRLDLSGRRVLAPLSYGDPAYAAQIAQVGSELLKDSFVPITQFVPLAEYNELLNGCGIVMIGAHRQLALGNILRAVWQGAHIVLDKRSPVVAYLRRHGVAVMLVEDLKALGLPVGLLGAEALAKNMDFLDSQWSRRTVLNNVRALLDPV